MRVLTCVLIALAHTLSANGIKWDKPMSLTVLGKDMQALEKAYPGADLWPDSRLIKYSDDIKVVVNHDHYAQTLVNGKATLMVVGKITLAKMKVLPKNFRDFGDTREVQKLLFKDGWFFFENTKSEAIMNFEEYYIVDYSPFYTGLQKKPTIEYISQIELEKELMEFVPRIRYESTLTGASKVNTYFHMQRGGKVNVWYNQPDDLVVFNEEFHIIVMSDDQKIIQDSVQFDKLSFLIYKQLSLELSKVGLVYGARVAHFKTQHRPVTPGLLRIQRNILLKDMMEASPQRKNGEDILGMITYDVDKECSLKYITTNKRERLRISGRFVSDGTPFSSLCVAFPEGSTDRKSVNWYRNSEVFNENPVFFTCNPGETASTTIVLQDDIDYIELEPNQNTQDIVSGLTSIMPYIEYVPYSKFTQTLIIVTDALKIRCAKGYPRRTFRLFRDIRINYDCSSGIANLDTFDMWIGPSKDASFIWENIDGVSFNSHHKRFEREDAKIFDFKVRQLYPVYPDKLPVEMRYSTHDNKIFIAFDIKSIEWDLYELRKDLLGQLLPMWGVVQADEYDLFKVEKSKEDMGGEIVRTITVGTNTWPDNCNMVECVIKDEIIYDGHKMTMRNNRPLEQRRVPSKVYWQRNYKLNRVNKQFSVGKTIHYVKLPTFRRHMHDLTLQLQNRCHKFQQRGIGGDKLTVYIYYSKDEAPVIGYFDCTLTYIFFISDFKIIKFPSIDGVSNGYRPGEEEIIGITSPTESVTPIPYFDGEKQNIDRTKPLYESEEEELRRKYADYILEDLIYDPYENTFHSRTMFLTDVYAVRPLPTHIKEPPKGKDQRARRLRIEGGPDVLVY